MLPITIPENRLFNETTEEFIYVKETKLQLEHSLISLSKWESKWHKPFMSDKYEKTSEEIIDYIRCMTISQNVDPMVYKVLSQKTIDEIYSYINNPMTATTFYEDKENKTINHETITNELVYYWMIQLQIPFECERWHLNRLLTLIKVCSIKNTPPKKMSKREIMSRNAMLNKQRRSMSGSKG